MYPTTSTTHASPASPEHFSDRVSDQSDEIRLITPTDMEGTLHEIAASVQPWETGQFVFVRKLQDALRNQGRVDLMIMPTNTSERKVVVKKMPNTWIKAGPLEFQRANPASSERPWHDLGFVKQLSQRGCPYVCNFIGIFNDDRSTYVVSELANQGDLFDWCNRDPKPSKCHTREDVIKPLVIQIFEAVRWIHTLGVSHRDISLENILLHKDDKGLHIKLVDFGMGTLKRWCQKEVRGKPSYQAPEVHEGHKYDAFLIDTFALGIVVFGMAVQDYPWSSSKKHNDKFFEYYITFGFAKLLERRKLRNSNSERLIDYMSSPLMELLEGLLEVDPQDRLTLGEPCWADDEDDRRSIWEMAWLEGYDT